MSVDELARRHLRLLAGAVTASLLRALDDALGRGLFQRDDVERRFPFLAEVAAENELLAEGLVADPTTFVGLATNLADQVGGAVPLARAAAVGGDAAAEILAAAVLVEQDHRFGAVIASLQEPDGAQRPCLGLLALLLDRDHEEVADSVTRLASAGLLTVERDDVPRANQTVRVPPALLPIIEGSGDGGVPSPVDAPGVEQLVLPDDVRGRVERGAGLLSGGDLDAVIVRGQTGSGRRTVLQVMAAGLGRGLLVASPDDPLAGPVAVLTGAMLAFAVDPVLGQLAVVHPPVGAGPIGIVTGGRGAVRLEPLAAAAGSATATSPPPRTVVLDLPVPAATARRRFWQDAGLPASDAVLDRISHRYVLTGGTIGQVAVQAVALAQLDERSVVAVDDVRQAAQEQSRQQLESLAALLPPLPDDVVPVLSPAAEAAYESLVLRSRHREDLADTFDGTVTRGVRAMLSGPSGTGKTLTARALGARLDLDVYRADLAALVDKYIGETERKLDDLFTRAETHDVVLLIDEGDALMTRRTDVRSSNDRYANLETDYLLQRLETFEGIVVITTNAAQLVDSAFLRRLDVTITFAPPGPDARQRIWEQHLPDGSTVDPAALAQVARTCRLTGGQIRNAAVHAALLALEAGGPVDDRALLTAVQRELTAAGKGADFGEPVPAPTPFEQALAAP